MVDDRAENLTVCEFGLKPFPHEFIGITDPSCAYEIIRNHQPDLILLDLYLPLGYNGLEMARVIQQTITTSTPLIAVTAVADSYSASEIAAAGFVGYLERPFTMYDFRRMIETHLP